jgi:hypothetical protein
VAVTTGKHACPHCGRFFTRPRDLRMHLLYREQAGGVCPVGEKGRGATGYRRPAVRYKSDFMRAIRRSRREDGETWTMEQDVEHFT